MLSKTFSSPRKPDFICIGPDRTGTTWLYKMLLQHSSVKLPLVKEIGVLAEGNIFPSYRFRQLAFGRHWHYSGMRSYPLRTFAKVLLRRASLADFRWAARYALRPAAHNFSLEWYSSLFENAGDLVTGDITPIYYYLPQARVDELLAHLPSIKVILFVRNPLERVWSTTLFDFMNVQKQNIEMVSNEKFLCHFDSIYGKWPPYDKTIALWKERFSKVFVGRFDDLRKCPRVFFDDICDFLEIPRNEKIGFLDQKINKGSEKKITPELADHLRMQYTDEIYRLAELGYCRDPRVWLDFGRE